MTPFAMHVPWWVLLVIFIILVGIMRRSRRRRQRLPTFGPGMCRVCGAQVPAHANYCRRCGRKLD